MSADDSAPAMGIDHVTVVPRNAPQAQEGGDGGEDDSEEGYDCNCECSR